MTIRCVGSNLLSPVPTWKIQAWSPSSPSPWRRLVFRSLISEVPFWGEFKFCQPATRVFSVVHIYIYITYKYIMIYIYTRILIMFKCFNSFMLCPGFVHVWHGVWTEFDLQRVASCFCFGSRTQVLWPGPYFLVNHPTSNFRAVLCRPLKFGCQEAVQGKLQLRTLSSSLPMHSESFTFIHIHHCLHYHWLM